MCDTKIKKAFSLHSSPAYTDLVLIGQGATSKVYLANHPIHKKVTIKTIDPKFIKSSIGAKLIKNQINVLSSINHKNILKFIQNFEKDGKKNIVTHYCSGGDLEQLLKKKKTMDLKSALRIFMDILEGCAYLFDKGILHRDIKPANIFIEKDKAVIADFGFATYQTNKDMMKLNVGSPYYMSPESLASKTYNQKSEIFSLGVLLFELLAGKTPWQAKSELQLLQKIEKISPSTQNIKECPQNLKKILLRCLLFDPKKRPTLPQLIQHIKKHYNNSLSEHLATTSNTVKLPTQISTKSNNNKQAQQKPQRRIKSISVYDNFKAKKLKLSQKQNIDHDRQNSNTRKKPSQSIMLPSKDKGMQIKKKPLKIQEILQNIKPEQFRFLPISLISKLQAIVSVYNSMLLSEKTEEIPEKITAGDDETIKQITQCKSQRQLCYCIEGFVRRLYRLTKSYKGAYDKQFRILEGFHDHVISQLN